MEDLAVLVEKLIAYNAGFGVEGTLFIDGGGGDADFQLPLLGHPQHIRIQIGAELGRVVIVIVAGGINAVEILAVRKIGIAFAGAIDVFQNSIVAGAVVLDVPELIKGGIARIFLCVRTLHVVGRYCTPLSGGNVIVIDGAVLVSEGHLIRIGHRHNGEKHSQQQNDGNNPFFYGNHGYTLSL